MIALAHLATKSEPAPAYIQKASSSAPAPLQAKQLARLLATLYIQATAARRNYSALSQCAVEHFALPSALRLVTSLGEDVSAQLLVLERATSLTTFCIPALHLTKSHLFAPHYHQQTSSAPVEAPKAFRVLYTAVTQPSFKLLELSSSYIPAIYLPLIVRS